MSCATPADLPPDLRREWARLAMRYRSTRTMTREAADRAAFVEVRSKLYQRDALSAAGKRREVTSSDRWGM